MRYAARSDANRQEIVGALLKVGAEVKDLRFPCDLGVRLAGRLYFLEISGITAYRKRKKAQLDNFAFFGVVLVKNVDEALRAVGLV
jgi:hypothetical protein